MPTTNPTASTGRLSQKVVMNRLRIRSTTAAVVMLIEAPYQRSDDQVPAVDQNEQQKGEKQHGADLERDLQLAENVSRDQGCERHIRRFGRSGRMRKLDKE